MKFPEGLFEKTQVGEQTAYRDKKTGELFNEDGSMWTQPPTKTQPAPRNGSFLTNTPAPAAPAETPKTPAPAAPVETPRTPAPAAPKIKFSSSRAQTLVDGEYEYSIDPSSGVIKFIKAPAGREHLVGKYLTSANQKNAVAYKAIMDMFRAGPVIVPEEVEEDLTPEPTEKPQRRGGILPSLLRSNVSDIGRSDI